MSWVADAYLVLIWVRTLLGIIMYATFWEYNIAGNMLLSVDRGMLWLYLTA